MEDSSDGWKRWLYGVILPLCGLYFGIMGIINQEDIIAFRVFHYPVTGKAAVASSLGNIALCILCHVKCFWLDNDKQGRVVSTIFILSILGIVSSAIYCALALNSYI